MEIFLRFCGSYGGQGKMTTKKEKQAKRKAILLVNGNRDGANFSDMYWATGFKIHDQVIFIQTLDDNKKILVTKPLETGRAKKEAKVNQIIDEKAFMEEKTGKYMVNIYESLPLILKDLKIDSIIVPEYFNLKLGMFLMEQGFSVKIKDEPFFEQRTQKTQQEIAYIADVQKIIEQTLWKTVDIIKQSRINGDFVYYQGEILTSEYLRKFIKDQLHENNCSIAEEIMIIVTSDKEQTCDPHCYGHGPIIPNNSIIIDISPYSMETNYFADMTRTVVKGKAPQELREVYQIVLEAQDLAIKMLESGREGFEIHTAVKNFFDGSGNKQWFIHGTGHSVGLDLHEGPRIRDEKNQILHTNNIVTVEPGLYNPEIGGVRIEDLLVVTENGYENLTKSPKEKLMEL